MAQLSASRLRVLHVLRLKGVAEVPSVAVAAGVDDSDAQAVVADLQGEGLVERREGALAGWAPTALGRKHDDVEVAEELAAAGGRAALAGVYEQFLARNPELLAVCAAWQLRPPARPPADRGPSPPAPPVANDHTDPAYDADVTARLADIHRRVQPVLEVLSTTLDRFAPYRARLAHALARVQAGEGDWFTRPVIDSYHNVWFELHQDLLQTLGLQRGSEGGGPTGP